MQGAATCLISRTASGAERETRVTLDDPAWIILSDLVTRSWNSTPIARRTTDDYVNATAMCKANGKQWNDYWRTDRATEYLEALSAETGIPVSGLCVSTKGGAYQGTWIHPRVSVDLARWISAEFAVWMDGWLLEELEQRRVQATAAPDPIIKVLAPADALDIIERSIGLLQRLGVMDERDCLQMGDMVRNVNARAAGGLLLAPTDPDNEELTLSEAWLEVMGETLPRAKRSSIGRLIAAMFREEFNEEPPTRRQYVDGGVHSVKSYRRGWLTKAVCVIRDKMLGKAPES